jgi:hypothetical protein
MIIALISGAQGFATGCVTHISNVKRLLEELVQGHCSKGYAEPSNWWKDFPCIAH